MSEPEVGWLDGSIAEVGGLRFLVSEVGEVYRGTTSDDERFILVKQPEYLRRCIETYTRLAPKNIVEIGIYQGGSAAFWNLVLRPERHLVFDLYDRNVEPLERFASSAERVGRLDVRYGIDQGDTDAVAAAAMDIFGEEPIDLVIDDGAHSYPETRAAFETLFPRLRPGGVYVIEDWGWAHVVDPDLEDFSRNRPALTNLVVELLMACASRTGAIGELAVDARGVQVVRGDLALAMPFRLTDHYNNRGIPYRPLL